MTSAVWELSRRKELSLLNELVDTTRMLNNGSNFTKNVERCIEISVRLSESHIQGEIRPSFVHFLQDSATSKDQR